MRRGLKENEMTVACDRQQKRHIDDSSGFSSMQSYKKIRVLEPLQQSVAAASFCASTGFPSTSPSGPGTTTASAKKKRSRIDGLETCISPSAGKRGKRPDGRNSAAVSPRTAAAVLEEQLTFPGMERDPDLEVQQVYINNQMQQKGNSSTREQCPAIATADRVSTPLHRSFLSDAVTDCAKDAAKSSRGRDQALSPRGRDQQQPYRSTETAEESSPFFGEGSPQPEEHVCLNLVTDKEWQRLFAVLTISGQPKRASEQGEQQQQQPPSSNMYGIACSSAGAASSSAAAAAANVEVAPTTPSRREVGPQAVAAAAGGEVATPQRRSFLLTEFSRVQARLTPEREAPSQRSSAAWK